MQLGTTTPASTAPATFRVAAAHLGVTATTLKQLWERADDGTGTVLRAYESRKPVVEQAINGVALALGYLAEASEPEADVYRRSIQQDLAAPLRKFGKLFDQNNTWRPTDAPGRELTRLVAIASGLADALRGTSSIS